MDSGPIFRYRMSQMVNYSKEKFAQDVEWQYYDQFITNSNSSIYFSTNISDVGRKVKFNVDQYSGEFCA